MSELTGLDQHVLRYWETEFRDLSPRKNHGGKRLYRDSDLRIIENIKRLLYEERFTIEGAKKKIKESKNVQTENADKGCIEEIKKTLLDIKNILDS